MQFLTIHVHFKKGVSPATGSPTATLLRLHSNYLPNSRKEPNNDTDKKKESVVFCFLAVCSLRISFASRHENFQSVTGGVYKA